MVAFLVLLALLLFLIPIIAIAVLFGRVNRLEETLRHHQNLVQHTGSPPAPAPVIHTQPTMVPGALPPIPLPPKITPISRPPSRSKEEWEALIGGRLMNRIGALALIIGVGLFLKYAFDHDWFSETARVLIGAVIGTGLLAGAARTRARGLAIFSQGLVGAGIAILYLSVYASFNFYHLVPQIVAFGLMTCVTIIAFVHAFRYDSLVVALFAWLGGFLTPLMLSTGEANELGLFTYVALLDTGILLIALRKTAWAILEPLALCATWLLYILWYEAYYTQQSMALTIYFVAVFWLLFHAIGTARAMREDPSFGVLRSIAAAANALFSSVALYRILEPDFHAWTGGAECTMAALYALAAHLVFRKRGHNVWVATAGLATGILLIDATAIQYSTYTTATLWAVEALGFAWLGARLQRREISWLAFFLFAAAGLKILTIAGAVVPLRSDDFPAFLNRRMLTYATLIVAAWLAGGFFHHLKGAGARTVPELLSWGALTMLFVMITVEVNDFFTALGRLPHAAHDTIDFNRWMALSAAWSALGTILLWIGISRNARPLYGAGLMTLLAGICAAALRGIAVEPVGTFTLILNWRCAALLFVVACGVVTSRRLAAPGAAIPWRTDLLGALRMLLIILLLVLVTGETRDVFERELAVTAQAGGPAMTGELDRLENLKQLSLSGAWLVFSIALMAAGILRRSRGLRVGSIVLFGVTILKIFIYDLSFLDTLYRIFSFVGLGVILLAVSYVYQRYKGVIFASEKDAEPPPPAAV
jgi:uncharacterized membrane protein